MHSGASNCAETFPAVLASWKGLGKAGITSSSKILYPALSPQAHRDPPDPKQSFPNESPAGRLFQVVERMNTGTLDKCQKFTQVSDWHCQIKYQKARRYQWMWTEVVKKPKQTTQM